MFDAPHFKFPFTLGVTGRRAQYVEQDSDDEIMDCVSVLLLTERGEREEVPDYGTPDQVFLQGGINRQAVKSAIATWVPRAEVEVMDDGWIDQMTQSVRVNYTGKDVKNV